MMEMIVIILLLKLHHHDHQRDYRLQGVHYKGKRQTGVAERDAQVWRKETPDFATICTRNC
jgi:hypothetical protein